VLSVILTALEFESPGFNSGFLFNEGYYTVKNELKKAQNSHRFAPSTANSAVK